MKAIVSQQRPWTLTSGAIERVVTTKDLELGVSPHAHLEGFNEGLDVSPQSLLKFLDFDQYLVDPPHLWPNWRSEVVST